MRARTLASATLRLGTGLTIFLAGVEKVARGPDFTTSYFAAVGVPFPEVMAPLITWFEVVGGICVLVGAATVVVAALVAVEMLAVILLVRLPEASSPISFIDAFLAIRLELVLALTAAAIAVLGPGAWSIDRLLVTRRTRPPADDA